MTRRGGALGNVTPVNAGDHHPITIDEIVIGDEADAWRAAGYSVDDDGVCRTGQVRIRLVGRDEGKRIRSWSWRGVDDATAATLTAAGLDGLPTTTSAAPAAHPATHPNGVMSIDHIVLISPDLARTTEAIEAMGLPLKRTRATDTYGAPFLQNFFRAGEVVIELIGPEEAGEGATAFFGLAFTVADLEATAARLGPGLGTVKDAVQPGRRIATLRHKDFDVSVATAFMSIGADAIAAADAADAGRPDGAP
jgi:hypothetical protein